MIAKNQIAIAKFFECMEKNVKYTRVSIEEAMEEAGKCTKYLFLDVIRRMRASSCLHLSRCITICVFRLFLAHRKL